MTVSDRNIFSTDATRPAASETASFKLPASFDGGTLVASRYGGGAVKGSPVQQPVFSPPKATRLEGYNNIVQFSGAKTPAARPPGVAAVPGQTFFAQGAFVFSAPAGDDTIAGRRYVGFAPGFSALAALRMSMQAQNFPSGNKVIWGEGLAKEHQVTADDARRFLETEGSVEDSRSGRALQRAEEQLQGKLLGIMNELARQQKPATPAPVTQKPVTPAPKPAPVAANPPRETKPAPASPQPEATLPPYVRPKASPLPPPPKFDEPLVPNPFQGPSPPEIAAKHAGLQRMAADAAIAPVKSWGDAQKELNALNQRLTALGPSPAANKANGLLADLSNLIVRGERLEQGLNASRAGERPDVVVGSTVLPPKEAARSLQQIRDEVANKLTALRKEIDGLSKSSATRQSLEPATNPFATPERTGPIVLPGAPKASGEQPGKTDGPGYVVITDGSSGPKAAPADQKRAADEPTDVGGGGTTPPIKPPTGGGGNNDGVPDPDKNPEEWEQYIASFRENFKKLLDATGKKLSDKDLDRVMRGLKALRQNSNYNKSDFMKLGKELADVVSSKKFAFGIPLNSTTTAITGIATLSLPMLSLFANNNPKLFRDVIDKMYGPNPINVEVPSLNSPVNDVAGGGTITGNYGQDAFVVGQPPKSTLDLASTENYKAEVKRLEDWALQETRRLVKISIDNVNAQKGTTSVGETSAIIDRLTRILRGRDLDNAFKSEDLAAFNLNQNLQSTVIFQMGKIDSSFNIGLSKLRDGRTLAISNLVNTINADVAQTRASIRSSTGEFTFIPSPDPSADMNRIDINIREAQRYQKELATGQAQVQAALDKLEPYLAGLQDGGAALEGASALKQSQTELQALLATIQGQQNSMGNTLLTLGQNRQSLQIAMKNLSLSQQNTGLNEENAVRSQTARDEAAAANQRTLGKSAMDRWNAPAAAEAQPIQGAPGFRKPFSGRGNLLEKLDDAVRPFGLSANDVPASVWLRVLDQLEPNWIYAVMEPTAKPLTQEQVTKRKAEILNQAGAADEALLKAVLGTMRNR